VHRIAGMLRDQLRDEPVSVPRTYRPRSDKYAVFMDLAPGLSLHEAVAAASSQAGKHEAVRLTAGALVRLHALRLEERLKEKRTLPQGVEHAQERAGRLRFAAPEMGRKAERLLEYIDKRLPRHDGALTFLHGDFKGTQVLIDGDAIAVIDLDSACIGDPAVDVGNMMADLHREAALAGAAESRDLAELFLDEYMARSGRSDLAARARAFRAIALVRMSVHGFRQFAHIYGQPDSQPEVLLREAEACLSAL
jgi:aminoglycoside phosphotransferase (APT) family kinase protein